MVRQFPYLPILTHYLSYLQLLLLLLDFLHLSPNMNWKLPSRLKFISDEEEGNEGYLRFGRFQGLMRQIFGGSIWCEHRTQQAT